MAEKKVRRAITLRAAVLPIAEKLAHDRGVPLSRFLELLLQEEHQRMKAEQPTDLNSPALLTELRNLGILGLWSAPARKPVARRPVKKKRKIRD